MGIVGGGEAGEEEFEVIVDLGEGADGRAGGADVVFLLDGDGGRDAFDGIDVRFVHAVEELPDVGREGLDVAALALGVEGVEGERGFAGAGGAGDDGEFAERDLQIEVLEVVLAAAVEADGGGIFRVGWHAGILGGKRPGRQRKCSVGVRFFRIFASIFRISAGLDAQHEIGEIVPWSSRILSISSSMRAMAAGSSSDLRRSICFSRPRM